jgi:uncharacterized membrane protein
MPLYRDPRDRRVFVARRNGGVALNFGHPVAWALLIGMTIIPLVVVAVVMVGVLR